MRSWGLLDKTLCVVFQAWPQAITKALPGRPHQNAALLTPEWGHSCASQSEGGCTQGPRSSLLLTSFTYFHPKPNTFTPRSWGLGWGPQMPLQRPPYEGRSGSQEDTFPTLVWYPVLFHSLPSHAPHNLRVYKTARVFCSGPLNSEMIPRFALTELLLHQGTAPQRKLKRQSQCFLQL